MATKVTGLAQTTFTVADSGTTARDIRNAIRDWKLTTPRAVQDVTGIDKSARETLLLLADLTITIDGVFDTLATSGAHAVFSTVPSTSVARAVAITTNAKSLNFNANFTDYAVSRSNTGELTFSAPGVLSDGSAPTWS